MSANVGKKRLAGTTAVVVGASMAGLCAARVLSERFDAVVVLDRDDLRDDTNWRRHVPQGRHPHLLLPAGARLLECWFPGLTEELVGAGAVRLDLCRDFYWYQSGGVWRRPASTLHSPAMSRPLLERAVRRRVAAVPNVTIRGGGAVDGLDCSADRSRITGARLADGTSVACQLLVDATGRQARSLGWIETLGYQTPDTSVVDVDTRYVTRLYQRTEDPGRDWKAAAVVADPHERRLAMVMPLEGDRWFVTFGGLNGEAAPTDDDGLLAYARSLPVSVAADVIETSPPLGDPVIHRFPANQRRHLERLRRFPLGWVLLGDAVSSFDPIYGQGMTSAALQADALGACLDRSRGIDRRFARRYFRAASRTINTPWSIAVGGDFVYDGTTGPKPAGTNLINWYMDRVAVAAQHDDTVLIRLNEVIALTRRPQALLAPAFTMRAMRAARRRPRVTAATGPPTPHAGTPALRGRPSKR